MGALDTQLIQVRARMREHLENLKLRFPEVLGALSIMETPQNDYRYRLIVKKDCWTKIATELSCEIDYGNFKSKCHARESELGSAYVHSLHDVWAIEHALQTKASLPARRIKEPPQAPEAPVAPALSLDETTSRKTLCEYLGKTVEPPPLGVPDGSFRLPMPKRLALLADLCETQNNHYFSLQACAAECAPDCILELGVDIALNRLLELRTGIENFELIRQKLFQVRRFAQGWVSAAEILEIGKVISTLKPAGHDSDNDERLHAFRALYRALLNALDIAGAQLNQSKRIWEFEDLIPNRYDRSVFSNLQPEQPLATRLLERLKDMGHRNVNPKAGKLASERVRIHALQLIRARNPTFFPKELYCTVSPEALAYMRSEGISPALRVDGVGQFAFSLKTTVERKGTGKWRTIDGYGFTPDGEAVYIVNMSDEKAFTTKRCWKAAEDYVVASEPWSENLFGEFRPNGPANLDNLR